jgi:hypothetical protein
VVSYGGMYLSINVDDDIVSLPVRHACSFAVRSARIRCAKEVPVETGSSLEAHVAATFGNASEEAVLELQSHVNFTPSIRTYLLSNLRGERCTWPWEIM